MRLLRPLVVLPDFLPGPILLLGSMVWWLYQYLSFCRGLYGLGIGTWAWRVGLRHAVGGDLFQHHLVRCGKSAYYTNKNAGSSNPVTRDQLKESTRFSSNER